MENLIRVIEELDRCELEMLAVAKFVGRKNILRAKLTRLKPKSTRTWIDSKVVKMAGMLDKPSVLDGIRDTLLTRFTFDIVQNIMDNLNNSAVSRQRYGAFYKPMIPSLTSEVIKNYDKVGLRQGMPPVITEVAVDIYRRRARGASIPPSDEEEVAPVKVQTSFTVKLLKFDETKKVALIKEVKSLLEGMNLVQAKKFVESAPTIVKADVGQADAEKLAAALTAAGGTCEVV